MLFEIHMLRNYAPSNLNRDDTGSPKTCLFGGVQRGRISSQCLKRSWRTSNLLKEAVGADNIGIRTRRLPELVAGSLLEQGFDQEYVEAVRKVISGFGNKDGKENADSKQTAQVILYSADDIQTVATMIGEKLKNCTSVKDVEKLKAKDLQDEMSKGVKRAVSLDMALFGRMVTSDAFADVEAAMQVAHAISTNRVMMESDYFTAVDDLIQESSDETGSAMIGDIDYHSSCYYIYASLDTDKLSKNLENCPNRAALMQKVIPALVETMTFTDPSGKQNSFAAHSLPSAMLIECKDRKIPVSYANAFEQPVKATYTSGLIHGSVERLKAECEKISESYGLSVTKRIWFTTEKGFDFEDGTTVNCHSFDDLLGELPVM